MKTRAETSILDCQSISKQFGQVTVLDNVSLKLKKQEFLAILGPSGCGKSTLLRIIAGLETMNSGQVSLHGERVSDSKRVRPTEKRNLGMVFQNIALFPHLSVAVNIGFGLKGRSSKKKQRIKEMLELLELQGYEDKMPHEISGGEQQRVALARAFAPNPELILLDEPFSSLDSKLRVQLRKELYQILRKAKVSVILVTHDQMEAFTFADRLLVFQKGKIVQEGSPAEIYHKPVSPWVASFVGESNFLSMEDVQEILGKTLSSGISPMPQAEWDPVLVRPEDFIINPQSNEQTANGVIENIEFGGDQSSLTIKLKSGTRVHTRVSSRENWQINEKVQLRIQHFNPFDIVPSISP
ncbi:MAG: ABC transporter ATP-binding protein [SAR324 cluster bacterium]|nr:ABC transporter ATP-binding protein [SAR324 cluster bacterium]